MNKIFKSKNSKFNDINKFQEIMVFVSIILIIVSSILKLDYLLGILIGCIIICSNFYWTVVFFKMYLKNKKIKIINLFFYFFKFFLSSIILYISINYFNISTLALLIGLSNILIALFLFSVLLSIDIFFTNRKGI